MDNIGIMAKHMKNMRHGHCGYMGSVVDGSPRVQNMNSLDWSEALRLGPWQKPAHSRPETYMGVPKIQAPSKESLQSGLLVWFWDVAAVGGKSTCMCVCACVLVPKMTTTSA